MRADLLSQRIGWAVLFTLVVQRGRFFVPGARAAAIGVASGSTPLLLGPPDLGDGADMTSPITAGFTSISTLLPISSSLFTSTTQSAASSTSSTSSQSVTLTQSSTTSSDLSTASATPSPDGVASQQPSSIRFVIPVFVIIVVTLAGFVYSRYYARRHRQHNEGNAQSSDSGGSGWKEICTEDIDDEKNDPWYAGEEAGGTDLSLRAKDPAVSVAGRDWGWKSTFNAWQSARGKAQADDENRVLVDEMGQRQTIRLVTNIRGSETYQTIPTFAETPRKEERGSIRALRDKLKTLTYRASTPPRPGALSRNRSPNKRRSQIQNGSTLPDPPEWIQPRAVLPTSRILSPPSHPNLFFHRAATSNVSMANDSTSGANDSASDYSSEDGSHKRFPTIPSSADALATSYTALPPRTVRTAKIPRALGEDDNETEGEAKKTKSSIVMPTSTPESAKGSKRDPTTSASRTKYSPSSTPRAKKSLVPKTPTTLRRSVAVKDLASPQSADVTPRPIVQYRPKGSGSTSSDQDKTSSPRKSRVQLKQERAQDKVEDILKASWSDRALTSPITSPSIDGLMTMSSPGVEEAAVLSGGGIEQRLAMLRSRQL